MRTRRHITLTPEIEEKMKTLVKLTQFNFSELVDSACREFLETPREKIVVQDGPLTKVFELE